MKPLLFVLLFAPGLVWANDWDAFDREGAVAIMRHALAPGTGDPQSFDLSDCATQRNLDERGRSQARDIGAAFRERGISFDTVYTSQWCRTRDTAQLLDLGPVVEAPALNSFFQDFTSRERQTSDARDLIAKADGRIMLVSHQVNISALTGQGTRSGEILIIRPDGDEIEVLGSIVIDP